MCLTFLYAAGARALVTPGAQDREFVAACIQGFDTASSNGSMGVGRQICECTAKESKHQKVSPASFRSETAKIKADPKYQIQDPKLLAAFQYCTIETLRE